MYVSILSFLLYTKSRTCWGIWQRTRLIRHLHNLSKIVQIDIKQFSIEIRVCFRVLGVEQHPTQVFQIIDVAILSHGSNSGGPKLLRASRLASISLENSVLNFSQLSASRSIHMSSVSRTLRRNMWVGPVEKEATQSLLR